MLSGDGGGGGGGRFYWARRDENASEKVKGIVVLFAWVSVTESHLKHYTKLYSSLGWSSLVCLSDFLTPFVSERATSLAFCLLNELVEELRSKPCPVVLAAFSGGSKACMFNLFQIVEGGCEAQLNLEDSALVRSCIAGQIYDSGPVDLTSDLGARFALHPSILKVPGSGKLVSLVAKGFTSGLDALFVTRFGSQRTEYWQALYSSVCFEAPILILCSENDDVAPYQVICNFVENLQEIGADVRVVNWKRSSHVGHYRNNPIQYRSAVMELLEQAVEVFAQKIHKIGERTGMESMHDEISDLICDLQVAAVDSNQSLRRVALGPTDHFFLPSSASYQTARESSSSQEAHKERSPPHCPNPSISAHSVLGKALFDACIPKNVEGWDIKFTGTLNGQPVASARRHSAFNAIKRFHRSRL